MKVTKIEISNYKSIKDPITVHFQHEIPTVLIGKNGSGKTNILEALEAIASANSLSFTSREKAQFRYKAHIELSEQYFFTLFPDIPYDKEKCKLVACNGETGLQIDRVASDYLVPLLQKEIEDIRSLAEKLRKAFEEYKRQLTKISYVEYDNQPIRCFELYDFNGKTTNYNILKNRIDGVLEQVEKFINNLQENFSNEESPTLIFTKDIYLPYYDNNFLFKLQFVEPDLANFEQKFVSINKTAIKREITKINKATIDSYEKISKYIKDIDERINHLKSALTSSAYSGNNEKYYQFLRDIKKLIGKKCLFLKNESNNVIFHTPETEQQYRYDNSSPIIETYLKKVYTGENREELLKQFSEKKDITFSETELKEFESHLNNNLPNFETDMYDKISVEFSDENRLNIFLCEKTGEKINLNMTSAGRRWYFTYYFMKNTLEKDDLFIIDEPAGMLHPLAQKEVLQELLTLEKQGIKVIYSTHSPYLIPNDWEVVHFVFMSKNGSELSTVETPEEVFEQMKEIAGNDVFNLQEIIERYNKCDSEKLANNCYNIVIKTFETVEKAAEELQLSKDTIISWRKKRSSKKFRSPKLDNLFLIAVKTKKNIMELF